MSQISQIIFGEKKTVTWRNFSCLYRISTIYGVLLKFMPFFFQIYVEKNLCEENLCGEKMTNLRSEFPNTLHIHTISSRNSWMMLIPNINSNFKSLLISNICPNSKFWLHVDPTPGTQLFSFPQIRTQSNWCKF